MDIIIFSFAASFFINIMMFIPAYILQTDKLTDLSYALTFLILVGLMQRHFPTSSPVLSFMVAIWALRLGWYLLWRIHLMGRDKRFDDMRARPFAFFKFWLLQGFAVPIIFLPATFYFQSPQQDHPAQYVGFAVWLSGLIIETVADYQKSAFRMNPNNHDQWISHGLYTYCRFPNYLGEIMVWTGIWMFSAATLGYFHALVALVSPMFIAFLLLKVSGVPLLDQSYSKRFGTNPAYQHYVAHTPKLMMRSAKLRASFLILGALYIGLLLQA